MRFRIKRPDARTEQRLLERAEAEMRSITKLPTHRKLAVHRGVDAAPAPTRLLVTGALTRGFTDVTRRLPPTARRSHVRVQGDANSRHPAASHSRQRSARCRRERRRG